MVCSSFLIFIVIFVVELHVLNKFGLCTDVATPTNHVLARNADMLMRDHQPGHSLYCMKPVHMVIGRCGEFFRPRTRRSLSSSWFALLLLMSGIEANPGPNISFGLLNARSVVKKGPLIIDLITTHRLDVLAVCETWIANDDSPAVKLDCLPVGYCVTHLPRPSSTRTSRGGGLCVIHRETVPVKSHELQQLDRYDSLESLLVRVDVGGNGRRPLRTVLSLDVQRLAVLCVPRLRRRIDQESR